MSKFSGMFPALVTPFDGENRFNKAAFSQLLNRVYSAGVHGVYLNGSTGEGFLQSLEQRKSTVEAAVELSPAGKQIIVHVGAMNTQDAVRLAEHSANCNVAAVSALPPPGNYSFAEIKGYYEAIAGSADAPLIAYHFPAASATKLNAAQLVEICGISNIVGVKFTDHDFFTLSILKEHTDAVVFNGYDEVLVAGLLMGADGGIGTIYNLIPEKFVRLYQLTRENDWTEARKLQSEVNELIDIVVRYPVFPATKAVLKFFGIDCGYCLAPRAGLTEAQEAELLNSLRNSRFADQLVMETGFAD